MKFDRKSDLDNRDYLNKIYDNNRIKIYTRWKIIFVTIILFSSLFFLCGRLAFLMLAKSDYYMEKANDLHDRERIVKAKRGVIYDRNGVELAGNAPVCTISVIHSQVKDEEKVVNVLSNLLEMDENKIKEIVSKNTMREKIKSNVDKEIGDAIRKHGLSGVVVDEDYRRTYPNDELASKVLGFTGGDNQGIVGLEVKYDSILAGTPGKILTVTDAKGIEIEGEGECRISPVPGNNLYLTIDRNIQKYAQQEAMKVLKEKEAKQVAIILMNPQNGEILAMVNVPEYNLNEPFKLVGEGKKNTNTDDMNLLNNMWRNFCINDTYEPGSIFKVVTATAALEKQVVTLEDRFHCPGFRVVDDRRIRCAKTTGHGAESFKEGIMNSCNPVFIDVGARVGATGLYEYYEKLGLFEPTGIDLPGEANSIMHKLENIGPVELATISFGQSIQVSPMQLLRGVSACINGGDLITPHFAMYTETYEGKDKSIYEYDIKRNVISKETSAQICECLQAVVEEGGGTKGKVPGFQIGGKTATSEKLPRGTGKYISAFMGFAPVKHPQVIGLVLIDEPKGMYYGGMIAAPVLSRVFENILPYLGIEENYEEKTTETMSEIEIMD